MDKGRKMIRLTQPVIIQSFGDELNMREDGKVTTPGAPGKVLQKCTPKNKFDSTKHKKYQKGVRKLVYLSHWSCPDILNAVRDMSCHVQCPGIKHYQAMLRCMSYCVNTKDVGIELRAE